MAQDLSLWYRALYSCMSNEGKIRTRLLFVMGQNDGKRRVERDTMWSSKSVKRYFRMKQLSDWHFSECLEERMCGKWIVWMAYTSSMTKWALRAKETCEIYNWNEKAQARNKQKEKKCWKNDLDVMSVIGWINLCRISFKNTPKHGCTREHTHTNGDSVKVRKDGENPCHIEKSLDRREKTVRICHLWVWAIKISRKWKLMKKGETKRWILRRPVSLSVQPTRRNSRSGTIRRDTYVYDKNIKNTSSHDIRTVI